MIVMKFGGTSVGSADRIRALGARVREHLDRRPLVVVSALSGVTDLLIRGAHTALRREAGRDALLHELRERHHVVVRELVADEAVRGRLVGHVDTVLDELRVLYTGVHYLEELTPRSLDAISAVGERLSSEIVGAALLAGGFPASALDSRNLLVTDDGFGRALPLAAETEGRLQGAVSPLLKAGTVPVVGGFIGATRDGVTTTLGRGGSDWSAAIFGALLRAEEIQIWTDVDRILTVDPRTAPAARLL